MERCGCSQAAHQECVGNRPLAAEVHRLLRRGARPVDDENLDRNSPASTAASESVLSVAKKSRRCRADRVAVEHQSLLTESVFELENAALAAEVPVSAVRRAEHDYRSLGRDPLHLDQVVAPDDQAGEHVGRRHRSTRYSADTEPPRVRCRGEEAKKAKEAASKV